MHNLANIFMSYKSEVRYRSYIPKKVKIVGSEFIFGMRDELHKSDRIRQTVITFNRFLSNNLF